MDFYSRVKDLVKAKTNFTLQNLIFSVGLTPDYYYSLKKSDRLPSADSAVKIAQALNTSVEYLVTGIEPEVNKDLINEMLKVIEKYKAK